SDESFNSLAKGDTGNYTPGRGAYVIVMFYPSTIIAAPQTYIGRLLRRPRLCAGLFFQSSCCGSPSSGEDWPVSASIVVSRSMGASRKSRKVGALALSNNASSSGVALRVGAGITSLAIILSCASSRGLAEIGQCN